jgi:hypothetical protein
MVLVIGSTTVRGWRRHGSAIGCGLAGHMLGARAGLGAARVCCGRGLVSSPAA